MPIGLILLFAVAATIYFGLAERVLDRLRLTDTLALVFLGLLVAGSFITIPLWGEVSVNVGGAIIPIALAIYLLVRADTTWEWVRALLAAGGTALTIWLIASVTDFEPPQSDFIDPLWLYSLAGGVIAYLLGRSRRAAFVAGTLGVLFADLGHLFQVITQNLPSTVAIGGAGVFDAIVVAGFISLGLAELVGESRERLQGGPVIDKDRPLALQRDEGVNEKNETKEKRGEEE